MHSSDSNSDSDFNEESFIAPTKKQSDRRKIPIAHHSKQASRQPTASESRSVDNEGPSTSRQIFDNQDFASTRPRNSKRKSSANNEIHKNSKIQRLAPDHDSQSLSHSEHSANTSPDEAGLIKSPQPRGNDEDIIRRPSLNHEVTYPASGLKQFLHGAVYQLKHLMLVLNRAREMGYSFRLATEMDAAEKFDDLVLQYQNNTGDEVYRLVQLKHRQDGSQSLKASELLADTDGAFSVKKYFISWRKIKQNSVFSRSKLQDFILCTNIALDIEELKKADIGVSKIREQDDFLTLKDRTEQPPRYKLVVDKHSKLYNQLKTTSDVHQLAQVLAQHVRDSQKLDLRTDIFKRYHVALAQEVIDVRKNRFADNFIKNNLSATARRFRDVFSKQLLSNEHASENDIRKRLETCKLGLSDKFGKNLPSTHESELKQVTELPNDQIEDTDISDFLNVFTIAVDQPNEVELGEMIKRELGDNSMFNLLDANLVGDSFQNDILNWFKEKSGIFLKEENVEAFFNEIEVKLSSIMTMALNLEYLEMFEKCDILFKNENADLQNFLDSSGSSQRILKLFSSKQSFVSALRVHQTLKHIEKYHKNDSFIFLGLEKLLQSKTAKIVSRAFQNPRNYNLLVIDGGAISAKLYTHELWNKLDGTIANNVAKKMILIIQGNNDSAEQFDISWKISHERDTDIGIDNLKKCSQQKLLKKKVVKFQGQDEGTSFSELLGTRVFDDIEVERPTKLSRIIDVDTLVKLIRDEEILVGSEVKGLGEIEDYYISRKIILHRGNNGDNHIFDEDKLAEQNEPGKIVVLSDVAGMGKSTVLTNLARRLKEKEPNLLVMKIDLNRKTRDLAQKQQSQSLYKNDMNGAVDFLVDKLLSIKPGLESQLFKTLIKDRGNAALLLDGFDEICPAYENTVIDLLAELSTLQINKLVVTTRPHVEENLKEQQKKARFFLTFYKLQPFLPENQTDFLYRFWKSRLSQNNINRAMKERLKEHAKSVIDLLSSSINDRMNEFTGIPLQTRLVAENFQYPSKLPKRLNTTDLYSGFVKKKYDIYRAEKKCADSTKPAEIADLAVSYRIFLMTHQKFALDSLFLKGAVKILLSSQPEMTCLDLFKDVIEGQERTGIITEVIEGTPYFIHRTFAEYFAAEFLFKTLKGDDRNQYVLVFFLKELFVRSEYVAIRYFLNCLLLDVSNAPKKHPWELRLHKNHDDSSGQTVYHIAAKERNLEIMSFFLTNDTLEQKAGVNIQDRSGQTPLHIAVQGYDIDVVTYLSQKGADIHSRDKNGRTPLHKASTFCIVDYLLINGADIDSPAEDGRTPLHDAVRQFNNSKMTKHLLEKGANINAVTYDGRTVLDGAVHIADLETLECLFKNSAKSNLLANDGWSMPIFPALRHDGLDLVKFFLDKGANINSLAEDGTTLLHAAVQGYAGLDLVKYLFEKGVNIHSRTKNGETVLHCALLRNMADLDMLKYLVDNGVSINSVADDGRTVLHYATVSRNPSYVFEYLLEKGADIKSLANDGRTVLHDAVVNGADLEMVMYLLDKGADINSLTNTGRTVLHDAVGVRDNLDVIEYLLKKDININSLAEDGRTALHVAVTYNEENSLNVVKLLVKQGGNINSLAKDGRTMLHDAVGRGRNLEMVQYLLAKCIDINSLAEDGRTPLHDAVGRGAHLGVLKDFLTKCIFIGGIIFYQLNFGADLHVVKYLLKEGAKIDSLANDRRTLLHDAVGGLNNLHSVPYLLDKRAAISSLTEYGRAMLHEAIDRERNFEVADHLLKQGADINSRARDGRTPLHDAVCKLSYLKLAQHLLGTGANITWLAEDCRTPLHDAISRCGNLEVVKFLLNNGAKPNAQDDEGFTPLHCAVDEVCGLINYISDKTSIDIRHSDHTMIWEVVMFLQANGANANLKDNLGRTPQALAELLIGNLDIYEKVFYKSSKC